MKRIKLNDEDYKRIGRIVDQYREIEFQLETIQSELEKLDKRKEKLLEKLDKTRESETVFFDDVKDRFGEGKLDLLTFEYVLKE